MATNYYCVKEVSVLLGRSEKWVYENKTSLPGYFKLRGRIYFDKEIFHDAFKNMASQPK